MQSLRWNIHFFIKAWNMVQFYRLGPWTLSEMEPSQKHLVVAMATILLSAIIKLCILCHVSWTKHDNRKGCVYPNVMMDKDYNDTIYNNINCSVKQLMVKSACVRRKSQYHRTYNNNNNNNLLHLYSAFLDTQSALHSKGAISSSQ